MRKLSHIAVTMLLVTACGRIGFDPRADDGGTTEPADDDLSIVKLVIQEITEDSYHATVEFTGDINQNSSVLLHVCNRTDEPECKPTDSAGVAMIRSGSSFALETVGLLAPNDPGDELAAEVVASDPDGVAGSPAASNFALDFLGCVVNSSLDAEDIAVDGKCEAGAGCTLRAAITEAQAGNCDGRILIQSDQTIVIASGLGVFTLSSDMSIRGQSRDTVVLDGNDQSQVMRVTAGVNATIEGLTIANGNATPFGGGMHVDAATVNLISVRFLNNTVTNDGGTSYGGGLGVTGISTVTVEEGQFFGNTAADKGGGGIGFRDGGTIRINGSHFEANVAPTGAGIYTQSDGMDISNSLFVENDSPSFVGAVDIGCGASGTFNFVNSTFVRNDGGSSGAIFSCVAATLNVSYSTFADNTPGDLHHFAAGTTTTLTANVFGILGDGEVDFCSGFAGFVSGGFNVAQIDDPDCGLAAPSDVFQPPQILPLADNGGSARSIGLGDLSPAIDGATDEPSCPPTDQRGFARPAGIGCDSGAFEADALPPGL